MVFVGTMGVQCIIEQLGIINHDKTLFKKISHDMIIYFRIYYLL